MRSLACVSALKLSPIFPKYCSKRSPTSCLLRYRAAYQATVYTAKAQESEVTGEELKAKAREAGKNAIIDGYVNGLAVASTNLETYPEIYGEFWDSVNQSGQSRSAN